MWKTGHSLMKAKLKETGAKLAGEMSGHIFFNDRWFGFDDALYSAARLIEILSADTRTSADVFADFPDSVNTPELNIELAEGENFKFIESMFSAANFTGGKITTIDGMRVDFANGWGLVRASNTTPSLVVRFEADTRAALSDIQAQFRQLMQKIKPILCYPFNSGNSENDAKKNSPPNSRCPDRGTALYPALQRQNRRGQIRRQCHGR